MEVIFSDEAKKHLDEFKAAGDKKSLQKIRSLIESVIETPFEGIGKPEALKYDFSGKWSRRVNGKDRMIYEVAGNKTIKIFALKGHY
jgi:toxin YoeB